MRASSFFARASARSSRLLWFALFSASPVAASARAFCSSLPAKRASSRSRFVILASCRRDWSAIALSYSRWLLETIAACSLCRSRIAFCSSEVYLPALSRAEVATLTSFGEVAASRARLAAATRSSLARSICSCLAIIFAAASSLARWSASLALATLCAASSSLLCIPRSRA